MSRFPPRALRIPTGSVLLFLLLAWAAASSSPAAAADASSKPAPALNLAELKAIEGQVRKVAAQAIPATVAVRIGQTQGSGVAVGGQGYVLTAGHVAGEPGRDAVITFPDGKTVKAKTLGVHRRADAGLLEIIDEGDWPSLEMGRSADLQAGSWCAALGHALGYQKERPPVLRLGRLLRNETIIIQTDCPLVAGDSGGPLVDLEGRVIGVNSRIASSTSMNFHVPIDVFHDHWDRLVKGEIWDGGAEGKDSQPVRKAFGQIAAAAAACTVRVYCGDEQAALGTVVGPDGWILTKASELEGPAACLLGDGRRLEARLVGVDPDFDLAMLKVEAEGLPEIIWSTRQEPPVGSWVATPGAEAGPPLAVGVISVPRRAIPPASGMLGVAVVDGKDGAAVVNVLPDTAADEAGIRAGDVITHVDGEATPNQIDLIDYIRRRRPGEQVQLSVRRNDQTLTLTARLTRVDTPATRKRDMQNRSGGGISRRHEDFPAVLQHDTALSPSDCGGPLVDLGGEVVGVNIARGGRTETYAVPSGVLLGLMYDLISGRLAPPKQAVKPEPSPPAESAEQRPGQREENNEDAGRGQSQHEKPQEDDGTKPGGKADEAPGRKPQEKLDDTQPPKSEDPAPGASENPAFELVEVFTQHRHRPGTGSFFGPFRPEKCACPLTAEGGSPIFADFAAKIGTVPVNGYPPYRAREPRQ